MSGIAIRSRRNGYNDRLIAETVTLSSEPGLAVLSDASASTHNPPQSLITSSSSRFFKEIHGSSFNFPSSLYARSKAAMDFPGFSSSYVR